MKTLIAALILFMSCACAQLARADQSLVVGGGPIEAVPQFIAADAEDLWAKQGLNVKVIPFATGRDSFEALIGGQLDLAIMAEFPAVVGALQDKQFFVVAVLSRYNGNRIILKGDKAPSSIAILAGKPVGVMVGTNTEFMLDEAVQKAGIKVDTVNVAPSDIVPALARGDIFAGAPFPDAYPGAMKALGVKYQDIRIPGYATTFVVVATPSLIAKRPQALARFLRALLAGQQAVEKNPAGVQAVLFKALGGASSLQTIKSAWSEYAFDVTLDPAFVDLMMREGKWIEARGIINAAAPTEALFRSHIATAPLKSLAPDLVSLPKQ